jgi:hypothetical protein
MLCAYFLGHGSCASSADVLRASANAVRATCTAGATAGAQRRRPIGSPPVRRPDPADRVETIERAAPIAAVDAASRFEQALTEAPKSARRAAPPAAATLPASPVAAAAPPANRSRRQHRPHRRRECPAQPQRGGW